MPSSDPALRAQQKRRHYEANADAYKERARRHRDATRVALRQAIADAKRDQPCADCGGTFPAICMDFDHAGSEKTYAVADMIRRAVSLQRLLDEIAKCVLVCANCHRIRTHA